MVLKSMQPLILHHITTNRPCSCYKCELEKVIGGRKDINETLKVKLLCLDKTRLSMDSIFRKSNLNQEVAFSDQSDRCQRDWIEEQESFHHGPLTLTESKSSHQFYQFEIRLSKLFSLTPVCVRI